MNEWKNITDSYNQYHIPLDTMWTDIDYMYLYWDFTLDYPRFPRIAAEEYIASLHAEGKHFVPIIDAGIA